MQVLILEDDPGFQAQLAQAMMGKGFHVLGVDTVPAAEAFLRLDMADVLIFGERIGGRLAHSVALLAECRNPLVAAVLLTDRTGPAVDELFDLMPALVGILGRPVSPVMVTQVVMAAVANMASDTVRGRLAARWAAADREDGDVNDHAPAAVHSRAPLFSGPVADLQDDPLHGIGAEWDESAPPPPPVPARPALAVLNAPAGSAIASDNAAPVAMTSAPTTATAVSFPALPSPLPALATRRPLAAAPSLTPPVAAADPVTDDPIPATMVLPARPAHVLAMLPPPALIPVPPLARDSTASVAPITDPGEDQRPATPGVTRTALAIPRPVKPSPDSMLARVLARGAGTLARPVPAGVHPSAAATAGSGPAASRPVVQANSAALPAWLSQHHAGAAAPALPAPPPRPAPVAPADHRLNLA